MLDETQELIKRSETASICWFRRSGNESHRNSRSWTRSSRVLIVARSPLSSTIHYAVASANVSGHQVRLPQSTRPR